MLSWCVSEIDIPYTRPDAKNIARLEAYDKMLQGTNAASIGELLTEQSAKKTKKKKRMTLPTPASYQTSESILQNAEAIRSKCNELGRCYIPCGREATIKDSLCSILEVAYQSKKVLLIITNGSTTKIVTESNNERNEKKVEHFHVITWAQIADNKDLSPKVFTHNTINIKFNETVKLHGLMVVCMNYSPISKVVLPENLYIQLLTSLLSTLSEPAAAAAAAAAATSSSLVKTSSSASQLSNLRPNCVVWIDNLSDEPILKDNKCLLFAQILCVYHDKEIHALTSFCEKTNPAVFKELNDKHTYKNPAPTFILWNSRNETKFPKYGTTPKMTQERLTLLYILMFTRICLPAFTVDLAGSTASPLVDKSVAMEE